jgi:hypothetical protein
MFDIVREATGLKISNMREFCDSAFLSGFMAAAGVGQGAAPSAA